MSIIDETPTELVDVITAAHRRALSNSDAIVWQLYNGQASIRAIRRADSSPTGFDQEVSIYAHACVIDYGDDRHSRYVNGATDVARYSGFVHDGSWQYSTHKTVKTLIDRIRVGDTLRLDWVRSNDSDNTRDVGWHRDELYLTVTKPNGKTETYLVDAQVGPDNSARMIKLA